MKCRVQYEMTDLLKVNIERLEPLKVGRLCAARAVPVGAAFLLLHLSINSNNFLLKPQYRKKEL